MVKGKSRFRFDIRIAYFNEAKEYIEKAKKKYDESITTKDNGKKFSLCFEELKYSMYAVLYSSFALEAYINKIGHEKFKDKWKFVENIPLMTKWIVFPKILTGKNIDVSKSPFSYLKKIKNLRNILVHFKEYDYKEGYSHKCGIKILNEYKNFNSKKAKLYYNKSKEMVDKLEKLIEG